MESFTLDTSGKTHISKDLWQQTEANDGKFLFAGRGDSLKNSRVEVDKNADGSPSYVIGVSGKSPSPGFWQGLARVLGPSSGKSPAETVITELGSNGKIKSETHCYNGACFNITPPYCADILKSSGEADYAHFLGDLTTCGKVQGGWAKAVGKSATQKALKDTYNSNIRKLSSSLMMPKFFKPLDDGASDYRPISVDTINGQLAWLEEIARTCAKHIANHSFQLPAATPDSPDVPKSSDAIKAR